MMVRAMAMATNPSVPGVIGYHSSLRPAVGEKRGCLPTGAAQGSLQCVRGSSIGMQEAPHEVQRGVLLGLEVSLEDEAVRLSFRLELLQLGREFLNRLIT